MTTASFILIAEDSQTQVEYLKYVLEKHGYAVAAAADGNQALAMARTQAPNLIISDIQMPGMDGYSLCQAVKSDDALNTIPVILVTDLSRPQDVIRGLECGADNFVTKPYAEPYLLSRIRETLGQPIRTNEAASDTVEMVLGGQQHRITAGRRQILNLLLSTYEQATQLNEALQARQTALNERTRELEQAVQAQQREIAERQRVEAELTRRAIEITTLNQELEAFSYSVSHDLRAPLRHIDGFADLLRKHAAPMLDEKGHRYLTTISQSAKQMGTLVDDLLAFSRAGRSELRRTTVSLVPLVHEVLRDLKPDTDGRAIAWTIGALPVVQGDPSLLRQVLLNLIGNAIKYTRPREQARIEIGALPSDGAAGLTGAGARGPGQQQGEEVVIFVRDNGVGFDMQYVNKLFGVFQRLHSAKEFEGTGIGLANVQRIIQRHEGRVWAEGAINQGAIFYVALPNADGGPHND